MQGAHATAASSSFPGQASIAEVTSVK